MSVNSKNTDNTKPGKKKMVKKPEKTHWNLYSLQKLSIRKFVEILEKVLRNENMLIK